MPAAESTRLSMSNFHMETGFRPDSNLTEVTAQLETSVTDYYLALDAQVEDLDENALEEHSLHIPPAEIPATSEER